MLVLHMHPLSSYCHKVLIALYENGTAFTPADVNLGDPASAARLAALWPPRKMPVLQDGERVVVESSIIIEHLGRHHPGPVPLVPDEPEAALAVRRADRFYDLYVMTPMQKIVGDRLRSEEARDPTGVAEARRMLRTSYAMIEAEMASKTFAAGEAFSMADCAAAPALFYAAKVEPFGPDHPNLAAYAARLQARPSYARALREAEPYFALFPAEPAAAAAETA